MAAVWTIEGMYQMAYFGWNIQPNTFGAATHICLYTNDYDPTLASVAQDFTEVTGAGYHRIALDQHGWKYPVRDAEGVITETVDGYTTFDFLTGDVSVRGYFLLGYPIASNAVIVAEKFTSPITVGPTAPLTISIKHRLGACA